MRSNNGRCDVGIRRHSAAGDAFVDGDEGDTPDGDGKYRFNGKHIHVTWSKSTSDSKEEFHQKLLTVLPAGIRMFGWRKVLQDGTRDFYGVFSFKGKIHWPDGAKKFSIEGDTNSIRFEKRKPRKRVSGFLENTMAYCSKDGDAFGEMLSPEGAVVEQNIDEVDEEKEWSMIRSPVLQRALSRTKRAKLLSTAGE